MRWAQVFLEKIYFHLFVIISPWKKGTALHFNRISFSEDCSVLNKEWNWFSFSKVIKVFSLCGYYLTLKKSGLFIWTNKCFLSILVEIGWVGRFWGQQLISCYLLYEKGVSVHWMNFEINFCVSRLFEIVWAWRKTLNMRTVNRQTVNRWSEKLYFH